MNVRRIRYARLRMRLLAQKRLFRFAVQSVRALAGWSGWQHPAAAWVMALVAAPVLGLIIITPMQAESQLFFSGVVLLFALFLRWIPGRLMTLALIVLSVIASTRYLFWRLTETIALESWLGGFFSTGLFLAELYAWVVLVLGFFQTAWPLERKPVPMPPNANEWPTVDVLIPTYNEPLSVVRNTVYAAMAIDWPQDKIKVCLLDDGRRPEFQAFAQELGVTYMTRSNNRHAKAGNINAALRKLNGEYVAIFDCDHIPTRTFLQICMGWFNKDPKLAMLQTPHHFFSPDPFEKNLGTFKSVPNEGELFYGLVQDGNDLWNATFFCGSCAVMKRSALDHVGGIAVETVTEDAHTALKMHREGYSTAYLSIPQAAGFATESLGGHVGQRIRWARGMAQIFRVDNPLFGKGLRLPQRLCYLNAMLHFFYGLPRIVFLTAPLAYLLFGSDVIQASALNIALYALPHLIHANITNSRMQGEFRHSFWAEIYESVLAWYILRPTLIAFFNPKLGKFNVTDKGGLNQKSFFDWDIAQPYLLLMVLSLAGMAVGLIKLVWHPTAEMDTLVLNLIWTVYNLIILGASVAVAKEAQQVRTAHRVAMRLPITIGLASGAQYACETIDYSDRGLGIALPTGAAVQVGDRVHVTIQHPNSTDTFAADVTQRDSQKCGLLLADMTTLQSIRWVQCTFARADTWTQWADKRKADRPLRALGQVAIMGLRGFKVLLNSIGAALSHRARRRPS